MLTKTHLDEYRKPKTLFHSVSSTARKNKSENYVQNTVTKELLTLTIVLIFCFFFFFSVLL